jgi:hypothetical protein
VVRLAHRTELTGDGGAFGVLDSLHMHGALNADRKTAGSTDS